MALTRCKNCGYFWQDEDERFPSCHFESLGSWDPAPCEIDDDYDNNDYDEDDLI